ncbi:MAG TPA: OmpH family outer membrane protein [Pyrinomonadaceae bacterium]|nr:OmpH family outer membrane protein [Pyrinomonadaceae bacterium]
MKIARFFAAAALLTASAFAVSAQQQNPQRPANPAAPPATAPQTVAVPDSKMAMIYSDAFLDPKTGIARFNSVMATLNREFQPRQAELQGLQTKIQTLTKEIEDTQTVADPNAIRQKRDQLAQLSTDFKRRGEDAEAAYAKRRQEIFLPLQQDIGKALEAFAKARGITVIVDGSQVPFVYAADNIDITRAFIAEFNTKNPATAAATPAPAQPSQP